MRLLVAMLMLWSSWALAAPRTVHVAELGDAKVPDWQGVGFGLAVVVQRRLDALQAIDGADSPERATWVVEGEVLAVALPRVTVALRMRATDTGRMLVAEQLHADVGDDGLAAFVLVDAVSRRLLRATGVQLDTRAQIEFSQVDVRGMQALQVFGLAQQALAAGEDEAAEGLLTQALALEPGFASASFGLGALEELAGQREIDDARVLVEHEHRLWGRLDRLVRRDTYSATVEGLAAMGLVARLHLLHGEFDAYLDLESARAQQTTQHIQALRARHANPEMAFHKVALEHVSAATRDRAMHHGLAQVEFWPHQMRSQMADVLRVLGRRDEAAAMVVRNYQQPGPVERPGVRARHPEDVFREWGRWDQVVVLHQQTLKRRELSGDGPGFLRAFVGLDAINKRAQGDREGRALYDQMMKQLGGVEQSTAALLTVESSAVEVASDQLDLVGSGYRAFCRRVDRGWYDTVRYEQPLLFAQLARQWRDVADEQWGRPWYADRRLAHLLAFQEHVPARNDAELRSQGEQVRELILGAYPR